MVKYYCEYCNKELINDRLRGRKMHNSGSKHNIFKKAYYLELFENRKIKIELKDILKKINDSHKDKEQKKIKQKIKINEVENQKKIKTLIQPINFLKIYEAHKDSKRKFFLPDFEYPPNFILPPGPPGFKLPANFDFNNPENFPKDLKNINDVLNKYEQNS